jgi:hypothetical protein
VQCAATTANSVREVDNEDRGEVRAIHASEYAEGRTYLSYQPSRKARPRVMLHKVYMSQAGVAPLSISILSGSRAQTANM